MRQFTLTYLFFLCFNTCLAAPINTTAPTFDIKNANLQFDKINLQLSVQNLNQHDLQTAVNTLAHLTTEADECVEEKQKKINAIEAMIKENTTSEGADLVYLNTQKKELDETQAQCRLFSIRAKEAIDAYKVAIAQMKQTEALARGLPLWQIFDVSLDKIDIQSIDLLPFSKLIFYYLLTFVILLFLFKQKKIRAIFYWYSLDSKFFQKFAIVILSFYTAGLIGKLWSHARNPNDPLWQLTQSVFLLLILFTGLYFIYYFCKEHRHFPWVKKHFHAIQTFSILFLIGNTAINILGYHTLAQYIIFSGFLTIANLFITVLITYGIQKLYLLLHQNPRIESRMMFYFGYKKEDLFTEFLILKTTAQFLVWSISIYWIGESWGFATDLIEIIYDKLLHGIHIANFTLYPTRIISGIVVFCFLYLISCAISTKVSRQQQFEDEEETQVAIASIITYLGFSLALISGLLVAGFDFTGLAIIAGALSVGIGLGLQSIVNNFVSGIILLIEKPIRPGDKINVDGVEGFVKKIRVRSTQITTTSHEDIIVPNSDLITRRVTNYVFSDKYCLVTCDVNVAYGSDTEKVRDVLMEVAMLHDEVIKSSRYKPVVLFRSFGESALNFQLNCLIKDINQKSQVQSSLNYAIDKAFRANHLVMPFPQAEVHVNLKT